MITSKQKDWNKQADDTRAITFKVDDFHKKEKIKYISVIVKLAFGFHLFS
jgi:hypothetical protein